MKKELSDIAAATPAGWSDPNRFHPLALGRVLRGNLYSILLLVRLGILGSGMNFITSLIWTAVSPVILIVPYTLVVHDLLGRGWAGRAVARGEHGFILFAGLLLHSYLIDSMARAAPSILNNASMVRKTSFTRIILPVSYLGISSIPFLLNIIVTIAGSLAYGTARIEALWLVPLAVLLFLLFVAACGIFVASVAPYFKNIIQLVPFIGAFLLFAGPVFYPLGAVPPPWRHLLLLNPSSVPTEMIRAALFGGAMPDGALVALYGIVGCAALLAAAWCFNKLQEGFSDVL